MAMYKFGEKRNRTLQFTWLDCAVYIVEMVVHAGKEIISAYSAIKKKDANELVD